MNDEDKHQERLRRNSHESRVRRIFAEKRSGRRSSRRCRAEHSAICGDSGQVHFGGVPFPGRQQHVVPLRLAGDLAVQPVRGAVAEFSGDLVYLVLIRGSNLDRPLNEGRSI